MADESSQIEHYERDTYLGKPLDSELDQDRVVVEETQSDISMDMNLPQKIKEEKRRRYMIHRKTTLLL